MIASIRKYPVCINRSEAWPKRFKRHLRFCVSGKFRAASDFPAARMRSAISAPIKKARKGISGTIRREVEVVVREQRRAMPEVGRQQRQLVPDIKTSPVPAQQCVHGEAVSKIMNPRQPSFRCDYVAFLEQRPKCPLQTGGAISSSAPSGVPAGFGGSSLFRLIRRSSSRSGAPPASGLRIGTENWFRHCRTRPGGADEDTSAKPA